MTKKEFQAFIAAVEKDHFRTIEDTGANYNALFVWNIVRHRAGLEPLKLTDLPAFCDVCEKYHKQPHCLRDRNEER